MSHTPGPWKIVVGNKARTFHQASIRPVSPPAKGCVHPIAKVVFYWEEAEENARLIAAAPDLLQALQGWLWARENGASEELAEQYARAAIAKATQ